MKKVLILEDNPKASALIESIIQEIDTHIRIYSFDNVRDAYQCALEKTIDLFLIDIILDTKTPGDSSGLVFVENMRKISHYTFAPVIFITSLEDAKLYTYENLHCYSFIEKPFDIKRLKGLIEQCLRFEESKDITKTLYFRKDGIILAIEREDIVYAECINHLMYIHTRQQDVLEIPYITLKKLLEDIDCKDFIQCSRSIILNKKYISNMDIPNRIIQLKDGFGRLEIGITYKKLMKDIE